MQREDDHVYLPVEYPLKLPVAALVNSLKGVSAHRLRRRYRVRTHREHLWSPSYFAASRFAASRGGAPPSIIQAHVESRRTPDSGQAAIPGLNARACATQNFGHRRPFG